MVVGMAAERDSQMYPSAGRLQVFPLVSHPS
jgi:hypothetical protein